MSKLVFMKRRKFTPSQKAKIAMEAIQERESVSSIASKHKVSPQQVTNWKREFKTGAELVFTKVGKIKQNSEEQERDKLLRIIGELKVENDFLKKSLK